MRTALKELARKYDNTKGMLASEEATKMALIVPFLSILGYDATDPQDITPELNCDIVREKGEKVDYAVYVDSKVAFIVECKHCDQHLHLHTSQLEKYFVVSDARFAILTNGHEYKFYTDTVKQNIMDKTPFLAFNIHDITDKEIAILDLFRKEQFNTEMLYKAAAMCLDSSYIEKLIYQELKNPSESFVKYVNSRVQTSNKDYQYSKKLIQSSIKSYIDHEISLRDSGVTNSSEYYEPVESFGDYDYHPEVLEILQTIKMLCLTKGRKNSDFFFNHCKQYSYISYKKQYFWFVRVYFKESWDRAYLSFINPDEFRGEVEKTKINCMDDIHKLADLIERSIMAVENECNK